MRNMLSSFPTEKITFHKRSGETYEVDALVDPNVIHTDDSSILIEPQDFFERKLPSGGVEYYEVIDPGFHKEMLDIPDHYQTKVRRMNPPLEREHKDEKTQKKVFISHSSEDKDYTRVFVDLLFDIGLNEDVIVCSSYPGVGIPLRENIYEWLVKNFQEYELHVIYFLSQNYYQSAASLNEMGAAWAMKQKWDGILLPEFDFSDIAGCIDPKQISIKLDSDLDELKHRLGELKDDLVKEFCLRPVGAVRWETIRNRFIGSVQEIALIKREQKKHNESKNTDKKDDSLTIYSYVMLLFSTEDDGQIMVIKSLDGTSYQAGKTVLESSQEPRELAFWSDAIEQLLKQGYIKTEGTNNIIYTVTASGYAISKRFIIDKGVDLRKKPSEIIKEYESV